MAPTLLLLLFLLWLQGCVSGAPAESVYSKVQHFEGETLSVQCSYKSRKKHVEGKVWCKIRKKKCEPGFTRVWVQGPRYLLQDDAQAKMINITMAALRRQDSGRYWCMRNSSGTLYPLMGFQLEVFPVPTTERKTVTQLANILKGGIVVTTGRAPTSGSDAPFTTSMRMFTPGVLTLDRLLPSTASETIRLSSTAGYSFTSPSTPGPRRTKGLQTVTASPGNARASSAGPVSISIKAGHLRTRSPTTRTCHTSRSLLNKLSPIRHQDSNPIVLVGVLAFLLVPVTMIVVYGFWRKRHMGSYSMCRDPVRPWRDPPGRPEPPWKPAWFKVTYGVGDLLPEGPQEAVRGVKMRTCLDWSQVGGSYTWTPGLSSCRRLRALQGPLNRELQLREKGIGTPPTSESHFLLEERSHCDTADNSEPTTAWRAAWLLGSDLASSTGKAGEYGLHSSPEEWGATSLE